MADPASSPANRPWVAGSGADAAPAIAGRPDPPAMERGEDRAQKRRLDPGKTIRNRSSNTARTRAESLCKASCELSKRRRRFDSTRNPAIVITSIKPGG